MITISTVSFLSCLITLAIGVYALRLNTRSGLNRLYFLLCLCLAWLSFAYSYYYAAPSSETAWFWFRMSLPGFVVAPALALHFFLYAMSDYKRTVRRAVIASLYAPAAVFLWRSLFGELFAVELRLEDGVWHQVIDFSSPCSIGYIFYYISYLGIALTLVIRRRRFRGSTRGKREAGVLAFSMMGTVIPGTVTDIVLPAFGIRFIPPMLPVFLPVWMIGTWYAMHKYRLLKPWAIPVEDLLDGVTDMIFLVDADGFIRMANRRACDILGYASEKLANIPMERLVDPAAQPETSTGFEAAMASWALAPNLALKTRAGERVPALLRNFFTARDVGRDGLLVLAFQDRRMERLALVESALRAYADERLHEKSEQLKIIAENTGDFIVRIDGKGIVRYASPSHARLLGWDPEAMVGDYVWNACHEEDAGKAADALRDGLSKRSAGKVEIRVRHRDGRYIWLESAGAPIFDADGEVLGAVIVSRDITERRESEEKIRNANESLEHRVLECAERLRISEERYRTLVEHVDEVIFSQDLNGVFTYVSPSIEAHSGYRVEEIIGHDFREFVYHEDLPLLNGAMRATLEGAVLPLEYRVSDRDGSLRFVRTISRVVLREGAPFEIAGIIEDITEKTLLREELEKWQTNVGGLMDALPAALLDRTPDGLVTYASPSIRRFGDYTGGGLAGEPLEKYVHPDDVAGLARACGRCDRGRATTHEFRLVDGTGAVNRVSARIRHRVERNRTERFVVLVIEADEVPLADKEPLGDGNGGRPDSAGPEKAEAGRRPAGDTMPEFIRDLDHETITPLNAVIGFAQLLESGLVREGDEKFRFYACEIAMAGNRLLEYVRNLLEFTRVKYGDARPEMRRIVIFPLLEGVCALIRPIAARKGIVLRIMMECRNDCVVRADAGMIETIVRNLLSYTVKFTPEGGDVEVRSELVSAPGADETAVGRTVDAGASSSEYILIGVGDAAIRAGAEGVERFSGDPEQFDLFSRRWYPGAGLGLSLARLLVESHNGAFRAAAAPGRGGEFTFTIPVNGGVYENAS